MSITHPQQYPVKTILVMSLVVTIVALYIRLLHRKIKTIIITSSGLAITFYLGRKHRLINYLDIKAIHNRFGPGKTNSFSTRTQDLEINDGTEISFSSQQFEGFDEMKNAIWQYRLKAFEKQSTSDDEFE